MRESATQPVPDSRPARREFLRRAAGLGIGLPAGAWLAAACGSSSPSGTGSAA